MEQLPDALFIVRQIDGMSHSDLLESSAKCCAQAQHRHDVDFILSEYLLSVKGADAAFAAGVAPDGIVQFAQLAVDLRKTVVVGDQRVLFRIGQEAQAADEGGSS